MYCNQQFSKDRVLPLNPAQHWLLNYFGPPFEWYDQIFFPLDLPVSIPAIEKTIKYLVGRHDGLRTNFVESNGHWTQQIHDSIPEKNLKPLLYCVQGQSEEEYEKFRNSLALSVCQKFNLYEGPLFKVLLFKCTEDRYEVLFLFHHIIADYIACITLLREFNQLYEAFLNDYKIELFPIASNAEYMGSLLKKLNSGSLSCMYDFWQRGEGYPKVPFIKNNHPGQEQFSFRLQKTLANGFSEKLLRQAKSYFCVTSLHHVLVAPLYRILMEETAQKRVTISQKLHGRNFDPNDVSFIRTVGNFAVNVPVTCELEQKDNWKQIIEEVGYRFSELPLSGISYDMMHYINDKISYPDHTIAPFRFNYMGISPYQNQIQRVKHPNQSLSTYIEFFVYFYDQSLHIEIQYDKTSIESHFIEEVFKRYIECLKEIAMEI